MIISIWRSLQRCYFLAHTSLQILGDCMVCCRQLLGRGGGWVVRRDGVCEALKGLLDALEARLEFGLHFEKVELSAEGMGKETVVFWYGRSRKIGSGSSRDMC